MNHQKQSKTNILRIKKMYLLVMKRLPRVLAGLGAVLCSLTILSTFMTAQASTAGISLTTSPVSEVISAKPGTTTSTVLHVENNGPEPIPMKVKLFTFGAEGTSGKPALEQPTSADTFLNWASFSPDAFMAQVNVPIAVTMTLNIPKTANLGYNIGVAFEPITATTLTSPGASINGTNVILVLLNTNSSNESPSLSLSSFTATRKLYEYLPATFSVNVHNSGNIFLAPGGDIFISKNKNFSPGSIIDTIPVNTAQGNVLPGTNRIYQVSWSDGFPVNVAKEVNGVPVVKNNQPAYQLQWNFAHANKFRIGKYYAKLILSYSNGVRQVPISAIVSFWVMPWKIILLALLFVLIFIGLIITVIYLVHRLRKIQGKAPKQHVRDKRDSSDQQ